MVQALQSALAVLDGYQTQLADWADKPAFDYEAFVTISTWVQTGFEVFLM
jgi:STE24 endopeptidase